MDFITANPWLEAEVFMCPFTLSTGTLKSSNFLTSQGILCVNTAAVSLKANFVNFAVPSALIARKPTLMNLGTLTLYTGSTFVW